MLGKKVKFLIFLSLIFLFFSFSLVLAQDRELEIDYPDITGAQTPEIVATGLPEYVKYIFNFSVVAIGFVVFGVLIYNGLIYLSSAGAPAKMSSAREGILAAFLGAIILLSSYLIFTTINPQLAFFEMPIWVDIITPRCNTDADCDDKDKFPFCQPPGSCVCRLQDGACVSKFEPEETSIIYYEIPIGQMIKNGIWKTSEIELMANADKMGLLDEFENFLNEEIIAGGRTSNSISDINRYLKSLLEDCRCDILDVICAKPEQGGGSVGCTGDPCKNVRDKIDEIIGINREKIDDLEDHKNKLLEKLKSFLDEENKFFNAQDKFSECLERGFMLSQGDYIQSVRYYEELGIKTEVIQSYVPSKGDPFTFYCTIGGTMYDIPVKLSDFPDIPISGDIELPIGAVAEFEPLNCPGFIPIGEILNGVGGAAVLSNENLTELVQSIDGLTVEIKNIADLASKFNEKNCKDDCEPDPNPCFPGQGVCVPIPFSASMFCCNPASLPTCLVCTPGVNTLSPGLQTLGICKARNNDKPYYGYPGPIGRTEEEITEMSITKTVERIKIYEDIIFDFIRSLKERFASPPYVMEAPEVLPVDLVEGVKWVMSFCKNDDIENPMWMMLNCSLAVGNIGPDNQPIGGCHLYDFFCCTSDKLAAVSVSVKRLLSTGRLTYYQPPEAGGVGYYYPNVVPSDGTCNGDIISKASSYVGIPYSQGWNKSTYPWWCRIRQKGHCYPLFSKSTTGEYQFGPYVPNPPPSAENNMCLDCSGFISRVYRDLGILPPDPVGDWCYTVGKIIIDKKHFYEILRKDLLPGDLITTGCGGTDARHVVIYVSTNTDGSFHVWQEGGRGGDSVWETDRSSNRSCERYWRRKYECGTFSQP